jgi:hypothetical protein
MNFRAHWPSPFLAVLLLAPVFTVHTQQVDCSVQVNFEAVATTNKELLNNFAADLTDYLNNYKWGTDNLDQKVRCTLNIFIQSVAGENQYQAQAFVGSQRPIYGTRKNSAVIRLLDETWNFTYVRGRPINHTPYAFNDLTSFLDFYMYIVLGYDYDTYEPLSGTPFFQKAAEVANLGRSTGQKDWQLTTGAFSRIQLIDEILDPKFEPVRKASYAYHFSGLDSVASNPSQAYSNIVNALDLIGKTRKLVDPRNIFIKSFFDAKHLEIADLFLNYGDPSIYAKLSALDPPHLQTYEAYRAKMK